MSYRRTRVSSISLDTRRRKSPVSNWAPIIRIAITAAAVSFILFFGSHILWHIKHGTEHQFRSERIKNDGLIAKYFKGRAGSLLLQEERMGAEEKDFHDKFLKENEQRRKNAGSYSDTLGAFFNASSVPRIPISGKLPSVDDLAIDSLLRATWEEGLEILTAAAKEEYKTVFIDSGIAGDIPYGVPGTGVETMEEFRALQDYLDCVSSEGEWVYDPQGRHPARLGDSLTVHKQSAALASCDKSYYKHRDKRVSALNGGWDVRTSLKWMWKPSEECKSYLKPHHDSATVSSDTPPSRADLCHYLRHKYLLMVGDSPSQYLLHDLILDWTTDRPMTCYGDLYCKEHGICGSTLGEGGSVSRSWDKDVRVYERLPDPPVANGPHFSSFKDSVLPEGGETENDTPGQERSRKANQQASERTFATVLRYRRADSLFLNSSPSHSRFDPTFVHPETGVRDINMYSLPDVRRSDVVIISKAPIPVPRSQTATSPRGRKLAGLARDLESGKWIGEEKARRTLELVILLTKDIWLPELLESLAAIKATPSPSDNLVIYRGGWRMQSACASAPSTSTADSEVFDWSSIWQYAGDGPPPLLEQPTLRTLLLETSERQGLEDTRTLIYNLQTSLQNYIVRTSIAPRIGMPYLDLESATSVWRSGFVGGANFKPIPSKVLDKMAQLLPQSTSSSGDCLRMCLPSPGLALEEFFIGSLTKLFEWGWSGEGRRDNWLNGGFVPVRERQKRKQKTSSPGD